MRCRLPVLMLLSCIFSCALSAQESSRWCVSTNAADWAYLLTVNAGGQYAISRHFTLETQARWNPWSFNNADNDVFQSRQRTFSVGGRWWPWYTYSGWWLGARGQYQEYNSGGLSSASTEEGDALGVVLAGGYSVQITRWLNVDLGVGIWGGHSRYTTYACPHCGRVTDSGEKVFFLPDEMLVSAMFIF